MTCKEILSFNGIKDMKKMDNKLEFLNKIPGIYFWQKDLNGHYVWCNEEYSNICNFKNPQDMLGISDYDLWNDVMASIYRSQDIAVLNKTSIKIFEVKKLKNMENTIICITTKIPWFNENNIAIGTFGHAIDITNSYLMLGQLLTKNQCEKNASGIDQASYIIGQKEFGNITLTTRESECLFFYLRNRSSKEISRILDLSPKTVEYYIEKVKVKLNSRNKSEIFDKAIEYGFLNLIPDMLFNKEISVILRDAL